MKTIVSALAFLLLAGCAAPSADVYSGPMSRAMTECQYQAHLATAGAMANAQGGSTYRYLVRSSAVNQQRSELMSECMHQRGYGFFAHPHKPTVVYQNPDGSMPKPADTYDCTAAADAKFDNRSQYSKWIGVLTDCMKSDGYEAVPIKQVKQ